MLPWLHHKGWPAAGLLHQRQLGQATSGDAFGEGLRLEGAAHGQHATVGAIKTPMEGGHGSRCLLEQQLALAQDRLAVGVLWAAKSK